jgi:hypothetical protein
MPLAKKLPAKKLTLFRRRHRLTCKEVIEASKTCQLMLYLTLQWLRLKKHPTDGNNHLLFIQKELLVIMDELYQHYVSLRMIDDSILWSKLQKPQTKYLFIKKLSQIDIRNNFRFENHHRRDCIAQSR